MLGQIVGQVGGIGLLSVLGQESKSKRQAEEGCVRNPQEQAAFPAVQYVGTALLRVAQPGQAAADTQQGFRIRKQ